MDLATIVNKMIDYSHGDLHDINHFMNVYAYAKIICEGEKLDQEIKSIIEVAAIVHDIACPLCREKYGNTNGKYQEEEGKVLVVEFLNEFDFSNEFVERISYLVGHHHTFKNIDGIDYQILIEADYIVNAYENGYKLSNILNVMEKVFKTNTGLSLLKSIYRIEENSIRAV